MKENHLNLGSDEQENIDDDQLRGKTMNETIREVNGDADMNLEDLKSETGHSGAMQGAGGAHSDDLTGGSNWNPNDASAVRSGGTTDMDDQTARGAGLNTGGIRGGGTNLAPKKGVTGSDFDGQNASS